MFSFLWPDQPDLRNPKNEHYSVIRFCSNWSTMMIPAALVAYTSTKSVAVSVISMLFMPCYALYQGAHGMLYYRYHFGTPPFPRNPAHGVVVVNPENLTEEEEETNESKEECCQKHKTNIKFGMYHRESGGCQCEGGLRWRRGGPLSKKEQGVMDHAFKEEPIRILVMGDSLALGLGTDRSCMPLMPETLAKSISKHMGGRAVFWTGYGAEGAASSWTLKEVSRAARKKKRQQEYSSSSPPAVEFSDSSSDFSGEDSSEENENNRDNNQNKSSNNLTNGSSRIVDNEKKDQRRKNKNKNDDMFGEWKKRLHTFRQSFENDIAGPYDFVFIFAGGNDCKAAFIPFYGRTPKGDADDFNDGRKKSLLSDFERILEHLGPKMHSTNFILSDEKDEKTTTAMTKIDDDSQKKHMSLVVFPSMPPRLIPAFQFYPLLWLAVPLTGLIENNKRRLEQKYPRHVVTVDPPDPTDVATFETQKGLIWHRRATEDTLLCLRDVTAEQCQATVAAMTKHVKTKSNIHRIFESRNVPQNVTMTNAPTPLLSELAGGPGHNIFSVDRVHPNDEGYDFWGRFIAEGLFQRLTPDEDGFRKKVKTV